MNVRAIPRTAVDGYLKLVRLPLNSAISLLPGNGAGPRPAAKLALDRADAAVRGIIAGILGDPVLRADARERGTAAAKREQALKLHAEADRTVEKADARLDERQAQAARQRQQAGQRAKAKREQAARERETRVKRAAEVRNDRLDTSDQVAERVETAIDDRAAQKRLGALDTKADALREREKQMTTRDEAERLGEAAGRAKAERKSE